MEYSPYVTWFEKTATERPSYPSLDQDIECDICIIGGAFTGITALLHATEQGKKAILIEPGKVGYGCTGRAGGLIESGLNTTLDDLSDFHGRMNAHGFWNSTIEARDKIIENIQKYKIDCDYVPHIYYVTRNRSKRDEYIEYANYFGHYFENDPIESLNHDDLQDKVKMPSAVLGMHYLKGGAFNPLSYLFGLAKAAVQKEAEIYEGTHILSVDEKEKITIKTEHGNIVCEHMVICGNAFMAEEASPEKTRTVSTEYFQIVTIPLSKELLNKIAPKGEVVVASRGELRTYIQTTKDGRLIYGGPEFDCSKNSEDFASKKLKELEFYLPDIKGKVEVDYLWTGPVGVPMNYVPIFQKISNRHFLTHGFNGHGVAVSCYAGQIVVDEILEEDGLFDIYARIKPKQLPRWIHHAVAKATLWFYRLYLKRFMA